jgi:hypothetical protein
MTMNARARLVGRLIRLYPRQWRARYADELVDLLAARPPTWADIADLARNLLYTHLHPDLTLAGDEPLMERLAVLMRALRSSEIAIFCAFVVSIIAWLQFGGLVDGGPYESLVGAGASWPLIQFDPGNALSITMAALSAAADLALVAVLAGGAPLAITAWQRAPHARRLFLVPVAAFIGAALPVPIAYLLVGPVATINLTFATPITIAYLCWFATLAGVSAWALARAIATGTKGEPGVRVIRFAFAPSVLTAIALALMLVATVAWGVAAHLQAPQFFDHGDLIVGHATLATWGVDVLVMTAAALYSALAAARGATTRSVSAPTDIVE